LALVSLFLLSLTIFLLMRITGDPAVLLAEPGASAADLDAIRAQFGLDRPVWVQYMSFITHLVRGTSAIVLLPHRRLRTLSLAPAGLAAAASAAMTFSLLVAFRPESSPRCGSTSGGQRGEALRAARLSMPSFWVGLIMILFFSVYLGWLPSSGSGRCSIS